jgi:sarcosine oxidase, subunit alpha
MAEPFRTAEGGRIRRDRPLYFSFDGTAYKACEGDTLASALLANDVHLVGRSFKYHRPRGVLSAGSEEPNALLTIDRGAGRVTPNLRATQVELYDGLRAFSQNRFPSLRHDLGALAGLASPLLAAGFYYKTFMWPRAFWRHVYEPAIRAAAGLGRAPHDADPDRYMHRYAHCDVLVVGAGPAGLAAALTASERGDRVIVCDEQSELGGSLLSAQDTPLLDETLTMLRARDNVTLLPRTTAFGCFPDSMLGLAERVTDHQAEPDPWLPRERLWHVRARRVIVAAGAIERPLVFPGNDRPGVMLADAAKTYLLRYGVRVGTRVVVVSGDLTLPDLFREAGIDVAACIDPRGPVYVVRALGRRHVRHVLLSDGRRIACDALLMSGGWSPSVHLYSQSRRRLRFDAAIGAFVPGQNDPEFCCVGACNGELDPMPVQPGVAGRKAFVDFQNDVTLDDLHVAAGEGFRSIEHVKRYTTTGMATDQGKTSNLNALAAIANTLHAPIPTVGHTTFRMPYTPVTFGAFAGTARDDLFDPVRCTPMHEWAAAQGAVFEDVGTWRRARYFPCAGEDMHAAVARECPAVRNAVGLFDATTLGKIEITGRDAALFIDRLYTGSFARLAVGRCRYGLMLTEAGYVFDDGVVARLAPDRFHVTTTTGGAAAVLHHMEDYRQTEFTDLQVWLTSITEQWAVIAVQGPHARNVIAPLTDIDLATMPHMSVREIRVCGVPCRLFSVSFAGELGYEINVPSDHGPAVWQAVWEAGQQYGITPYGTETMHVLRAEKGYIIVGQETDGTVIPADLGLDRMIATHKRDFVGKRSLALSDMQRADRPQLVGLLSDAMLEEGAQVIDHDAPIGHVTSAYWSETLQRPIALALIANGRARIGHVLHVPLQTTIAVCVNEPVFHG